MPTRTQSEFDCVNYKHRVYRVVVKKLRHSSRPGLGVSVKYVYGNPSGRGNKKGECIRIYESVAPMRSVGAVEGAASDLYNERRIRESFILQVFGVLHHDG